MSDITGLMNNYRECVRNLWNTYFRMPNPSRSQIDDAFQFDQIKDLLFSELVLKKIGKAQQKKNREDLWPFLRVVLFGTDCPVLINRLAERGSGYWDDPVNRLEGEIDIRFIDYFDWDEFNYIDLRYYKVKILAFSKHPHLVGRKALIETHYAGVAVC